MGSGDVGGERRLRRGFTRSRASGGLCKRVSSRDPCAAKPARVEEDETPSYPPVRQYDRAAPRGLKRARAGLKSQTGPPKMRDAKNRNRRTWAPGNRHKKIRIGRPASVSSCCLIAPAGATRMTRAYVIPDARSASGNPGANASMTGFPLSRE